jgi:hypothetical protein
MSSFFSFDRIVLQTFETSERSEISASRKITLQVGFKEMIFEWWAEKAEAERPII